MSVINTLRFKEYGFPSIIQRANTNVYLFFILITPSILKIYHIISILSSIILSIFIIKTGVYLYYQYTPVVFLGVITLLFILSLMYQHHQH